ncbi:protein kinase-like domain-containing protein [Artemisia annua]|uniref:non-specific serine/threonine protein kinase n=1 Tax=Artemisia annua TaxID=35608 RepID=A0A2U1NDR1_ARTAN|nr:protein kinase-like domain-containing protein [Artemisia annua]
MTKFSCCFGKVAARNGGVHRELLDVENMRLYTYKDLQIATQYFSPESKIGEGGFGSVYKGTLKDGSVVAIKVLSDESRQGVREFLTEITVISDIQQENLVKLHGYCVEEDHRILVYGYLKNGSLDQTLLGSGHCSIKFTWEIRRKICIGVAKGLAYLHEEIQPHIILRDIKASNILLDEDFTPKISDFGLAKLFPSHLTHVSTRIAGTQGYLAPEYAIRGQLTRKADIYSFGILLLEIVTGRPNQNRRLPVEEQYLLHVNRAQFLRNRCSLIIGTYAKPSAMLIRCAQSRYKLAARWPWSKFNRTLVVHSKRKPSVFRQEETLEFQAREEETLEFQARKSG